MTIAVTFLQQGGQPAADIAALLADFLAAARSSLHLAIYDFRLGDQLAAPVVRALRERAAAGRGAGASLANRRAAWYIPGKEVGNGFLDLCGVRDQATLLANRWSSRGSQ